MQFERFEDEDLSQYSYAVGCPGAGEVAIVDPRRDIDIYLRYAEDNGVAIAHVLETHIHADFASGARELAAVTGAQLHLSAHDEGEIFEVSFPHTEIGDGDTVTVGNVRIQALHTPGHTPEHLSFLVYDTTRSADTPELLLSGDFLFVGSIGRPDLLGEEAKLELAHRLYDSLRDKLAGLPDGLEVHPAHGSGSMCGANISGRSMSTLGYERVANPYLRPMEREQFVDEVLSTVPPFPEYYRRMKRLNSDGPAAIHARAELPGLAADAFAERVEQGGVVVDLRDKETYAGAHLPGSLYVGHRPSTWGSWAAPYDTPLLLVARDRAHAEEARRALARVGLDDVEGYLKGGIEAWEEAGRPVSGMQMISASELSSALAGGGVEVLDVRGDEMRNGGAIEGSRHILAGHVQGRVAELPGERQLAVVCNTGFQSTVVASILERAGHRDVINVAGGMAAWRQAGLPVTVPDRKTAAAGD